jgi:hypothetical protein
MISHFSTQSIVNTRILIDSKKIESVKYELVSIHESKTNTMGAQFRNEQFLF